MNELSKYFETFFILILLAFFIPFAHGQNEIDSLKQLSEVSTGVQRIDHLNKLSVLLVQKNPKTAQDYAQKALELSITENDLIREAESRVNLANAFRFQRKFNEVLSVLNPTLPNLNKLNSKDLIAEILNSIGIAHYQLGHDTLSLNSIFEAISSPETNAEAKSLSEGLKNIGNFYAQSKNFPKAIEFFYKSAQVDSLLKDSVGIGQSLFRIGEVVYAMNNFGIAKRFFLKSLPHLKESNSELRAYILLAKISYIDNVNEGIFFLNIIDSLNVSCESSTAFFYSNLLRSRISTTNKNFDLALKQIQQAEQFIETDEERIEFTEILLQNGALMEKQHQLRKADLCYTKAFGISSEKKYLQLKGESLLGLARIARIQGKPDKERKLLWEFSQISDSISAEIERNVYEALAQQSDHENLEKKIDAYRNDTKIQNLVIEKEKNKKLFLVTLLSILLPLLALISFLYIERKRVNTWLAEKNHQISQQNEELNAINEQLESSRQELIALNQTKDKFFSIIAHDLKSPLVALKTFLSAINSSKQNIDQKLVTQFAILENSLSSVIDLINNLLFWALSQKDAIRFSPETFNLSDALSEEISLAQISAKLKDIMLGVNIKPDSNICTDKNMLLFIIRNLLANALKFTPSGGKITISNSFESNNQRIDVCDTGLGIEPQRIEKLFDLQKKVSTTASSKKEGSGLGLMLSREFAQKMGGKLTVTSTIGEGSIFTLSIPNL